MTTMKLNLFAWFVLVPVIVLIYNSQCAIGKNLKCPPAGPYGICVEQCNDETDPCPEGKLCCSNGCGHVCMDPDIVVEEEKDNDESQHYDDNRRPPQTQTAEAIIDDNTSTVHIKEETSTSAADGNNVVGEEKIYYIGSRLVDCEGVAPQKCFLTKVGDDADPNSQEGWLYFYDHIIGFDSYEEGYVYKLRVRAIQLDLRYVPADASSVRYELIEIISKTNINSGEDEEGE